MMTKFDEAAAFVRDALDVLKQWTEEVGAEADGTAIAALDAMIAEHAALQAYKETVRDIYDALVLGKFGVEGNHKACCKVIDLIEERHPDYFKQPPACR